MAADRTILWFAQSLTIEKVHPLQGGFMRLKNRHERRPELPIEPAWKFYPRLAWEVIIKHARVAVAAWRIFRIYRHVAASAHISLYRQGDDASKRGRNADSGIVHSQ
jgi:hypothetical protein